MYRSAMRTSVLFVFTLIGACIFGENFASEEVTIAVHPEALDAVDDTAFPLGIVAFQEASDGTRLELYSAVLCERPTETVEFHSQDGGIGGCPSDAEVFGAIEAVVTDGETCDEFSTASDWQPLEPAIEASATPEVTCAKQDGELVVELVFD